MKVYEAAPEKSSSFQENWPTYHCSNVVVNAYCLCLYQHKTPFKYDFVGQINMHFAYISVYTPHVCVCLCLYVWVNCLGGCTDHFISPSYCQTSVWAAHPEWVHHMTMCPSLCSFMVFILNYWIKNKLWRHKQTALNKWCLSYKLTFIILY